MYLYVNHAARALQSHDLSGEGIKLWITYILFWLHKDMEGLPGWVIGPMPGPSPRQHKHERQYTPSTHSVIPTRRIWNDDYDGQMIFGDAGGLKFPDICLTGEENSPKKPHPGNLSRPGIEPGPAVWQTRMLPLDPQRWTTKFMKTNIETKFQLMILNKFIRFISRAKTRYISCTHYPILLFLGSILHILQHRLLHKSQLNSLRTEETLVDTSHKAVEKAWMFNST